MCRSDRLGPGETHREAHAGTLEEGARERVADEPIGAIALDRSGCGEAEHGDGRAAEDFAGMSWAERRAEREARAQRARAAGAASFRDVVTMTSFPDLAVW